MYMVTLNWRGAMNVGAMRLFKTLPEAIVYRDWLAKGSGSMSYSLSDTSPPKLIKV